MNRHKHADLIHAWAEGAKIEYKSKSLGHWIEATGPGWDEDTEYRIKPKEPEWFDRIPSNGRLCKVQDDCDGSWGTAVILKYTATDMNPFTDDTGVGWASAIPLTNEEIEGFKI